jgi:signal transduction histidine kinase
MAVGSNVRLLIVEDSADDRDLIVRTLHRSGMQFEWRSVATPEGFREALGQTWSAILCDFNLLGFDAFGALEILKQHQLDVPFIIISGVLGEEAAVAAMRAGAHDFFSKERIARLPAAIEREIGEARTRKERRQAEIEKARMFVELQRALEVRDEFLVLASHELRTPLTVLRLQVEALARAHLKSPTPRAPGRVDRVELIQRQVDRFTALVDRLLDVNELSSGAVRLVPSETDLERVVLDVVERSREWIDDAHCALSLAPMESVVGWWDPIRLDGIVTNLLANAIKYGAAKPVTVSVQRTGDRALLSVCDQGIGMSADEQAKLFQKFGRAVPRDNYGGLGLGLWIVDRLARAHGGSVRVSSQKGQGATFAIELPIAPEADRKFARGAG